MISLPDHVKTIIKTLRDAGFEAYAVGGSVRDALMDRDTHDWDLTTNAPPEETVKLFPDSVYENTFGTVGIKTKNLEPKSKDQPDEVVEVTTYRSEEGYSDFRRPDKVSWGKTIEEDLTRRDFTINAIATDGTTIIDPHDGQKDIAKQLIRTVGIPDERFSEDALRIMRAVRFAAELGFMIEDATKDAISAHVANLKHIAAERIGQEFMKLIAADHAADGITLLRSTGMLKELVPELDVCFDIPQKSPKRHHVYDVGTHSVMSLKHCPSDDPVTRLATLLHDIGKSKTFRKTPEGVITFYNHEVVSTKQCARIADRLRLSKKQKEKLLTLVRWHQFSVDERQTDSAIRRFIRRVGKENIHDMLALRTGDRLGGGARETSWRLELYKKRIVDVQKQPFSIADLKVSGHDVMKEYSVEPGPIIGKTLEALFSQVEEKKLPNEREALLSRMRELKQ